MLLWQSNPRTNTVPVLVYADTNVLKYHQTHDGVTVKNTAFTWSGNLTKGCSPV